MCLFIVGGRGAGEPPCWRWTNEWTRRPARARRDCVYRQQYEQLFRPERPLSCSTHPEPRSQTMPVTDQEKAAKARDAALQGALTQLSLIHISEPTRRT